MKTLLVLEHNAVMLDTATLTPTNLESCRGGIRNVYRIPEDCVIKMPTRDGVQEGTAAAGDLLITFYEEKFPNKYIVVKSSEWNENLDAWEKYMQKQKEDWALTKSEKYEAN